MSVSVIIPVYQAERFIEKAVLSACDQKQVSEVILVEDGSTDHSLKICENLVQACTPHVKLFRHEDGLNHGAGASRNRGIREAKEKYIAFLDADDYFLPGRFTRDFEILEAEPLIDGTYNALGVHVYDEGERKRVNRNLTTVTYPIPADKLFEEMGPIGASGYFHGDTLTVRRAVFDKVGLFNEDLELSQDTHMWVKMAAKASLEAAVIDRPVAIRGVHTGNRIKDVAKFYNYRPLLFSSLMQWAKENNLPLHRRMLIWDCLYNAFCISVSVQKRSTLSKKISIFMFLVKSGFTKPFLLMHRNYVYSIITGLFMPANQVKR